MNVPPVSKTKLDEDEGNIDLSLYSIKFKMCTSIKQWSSDENEDGSDNNNQNIDDKLIMNQFALFYLCLSYNYSS